MDKNTHKILKPAKISTHVVNQTFQFGPLTTYGTADCSIRVFCWFWQAHKYLGKALLRSLAITLLHVVPLVKDKFYYCTGACLLLKDKLTTVEGYKNGCKALGSV